MLDSCRCYWTIRLKRCSQLLICASIWKAFDKQVSGKVSNGVLLFLALIHRLVLFISFMLLHMPVDSENVAFNVLPVDHFNGLKCLSMSLVAHISEAFAWVRN